MTFARQIKRHKALGAEQTIKQIDLMPYPTWNTQALFEEAPSITQP